MAKPPMIMVSLRVPEQLWGAAMDVADREEENLSDVIRAALREYVKKK